VDYVHGAVNNLADFVETGQSNVFLLRYEDLTREPRQELTSLFSFLNLPWEDAVLSFHSQAHNFGTEDPIVRGTRRIVPGNHGNWRALDDRQIAYLREHLGETAQRLGYSEHT
jgi:hypothetical protein